MAAALRDKGYTPFLSSRLAETGSTSRLGGLLTAVSSRYVVEHEVLGFTELLPSKAGALKIRTDKGGLTLINVDGPQAGCSPWAGRAAFWTTIQMYATARSLGWRHLVNVAGDINVYMDAPTNPAMEHFRSGWVACGLQGATAGGAEDMTSTIQPSRLSVDSFLVNEPLLPWSLRKSVWARGVTHPQVVGSDHLPVRLVLPPTATRRAASSCTTLMLHPSSAVCGRRSLPHKRPSLAPWLGPTERHTYGSMRAAAMDKVFEHLHAAHDAPARVVGRRQSPPAGSDPMGGDPPESRKRP